MLTAEQIEMIRSGIKALPGVSNGEVRIQCYGSEAQRTHIMFVKSANDGMNCMILGIHLRQYSIQLNSVIDVGFHEMIVPNSLLEIVFCNKQIMDETEIFCKKIAALSGFIGTENDLWILSKDGRFATNENDIYYINFSSKNTLQDLSNLILLKNHIIQYSSEAWDNANMCEILPNESMNVRAWLMHGVFLK